MTDKRVRELRGVIERIMQNEDDTMVASYPTLLPAWKAGASYDVGEKVQYEKTAYKVLIAHEAQEQWNPADSPSLFARVLIPDPEVIPEWEQPSSTNAYMTGDKVTHNGQTWVSVVDNNVWEPGVYGWDLAE